MIIVEEKSTISLGRDFVDAVAMKAGWSVTLHALPSWFFKVSLNLAETADQAQAAAVKAVSQTRHIPSTAATIQRF